MSKISTNELPLISPVLQRQNGVYPPPKIAVCALCRTEVEIFIGCVCKPCYDTKVLPFKKTTLKRPFKDRSPDEDW
jgi:hypothetical protein